MTGKTVEMIGKLVVRPSALQCRYSLIVSLDVLESVKSKWKSQLAHGRRRCADILRAVKAMATLSVRVNTT